MNEKNYLIISYKQFLTLYVLLKNIYEGWWVFFLAKSVPTQFVLTHIQLIPWILRIDKIKQKGLIFVSF